MGVEAERQHEVAARSACRRWLRVAGGDGNLLFNVGPMPDGRIEPRQVERLKEMGAWLSKYGESIYGTRGGPFKPGRGARRPAKATRSTCS